MQALLATLLAFRLLPEGFANREFREHVGPLLAEGDYGPNRATYDLGRLRMRGLVERIPRTCPCRVAAQGHRVALCYCRTHRRVFGPALAAVADHRTPPELGRLVGRFDRHVERLWNGRGMAAWETLFKCRGGLCSRTPARLASDRRGAGERRTDSGRCSCAARSRGFRSHRGDGGRSPAGG